MYDKEYIKQKMLEFIKLYYMKNNKSPSVRTIAEEVEIGKSSVQNFLVEMNDEGIISYQNGKITVEIPADFKTEEQFRIPVVGNINCGDPDREIEEITEYITVPASYCNKNCYALRAKGDSMTDAGIYPGDIVIIEKKNRCEIGDIVVALDNNGENTLKAFGGIHNGKAVLEYMNEAVYPGKYIEVPELTVQGVARTVIKKLRRKEKLIFQ